MLTLKEHFGKLRGLKLAYVGDGNNVAHSLSAMRGAAGHSYVGGHSGGIWSEHGIVEQAREFAHHVGSGNRDFERPGQAVKSAHAVYTDVWASMGQETEAEERNRLFAPYQVNEAVLANARKDTLFMHCLPAKRGLEVTDEVMESQQCVAFDQAENRLHVQKAVLLMLLQ